MVPSCGQKLDVSPVWDPMGEFWFFISQVHDIGARLDAAEALKMVRGDVERTLRALSEGVIRLDRHQNIEFINPAAGNILGWSQGEVIGRHLDGLLTLKLAEQGTTKGALIGNLGKADGLDPVHFMTPVRFPLRLCLRHWLGQENRARLSGSRGKGDCGADRA